jgi:hypothetical protein
LSASSLPGFPGFTSEPVESDGVVTSELVESDGVGDNEGLKVVDGYVDFDINHCSTYFLSGHTADEVKAVNPATGELAGTPIKTGDHANVMLYVLLSLAAVSAMGLVVVFGKKRAN